MFCQNYRGYKEAEGKLERRVVEDAVNTRYFWVEIYLSERLMPPKPRPRYKGSLGEKIIISDLIQNISNPLENTSMRANANAAMARQKVASLYGQNPVDVSSALYAVMKEDNVRSSYVTSVVNAVMNSQGQ